MLEALHESGAADPPPGLVALMHGGGDEDVTIAGLLALPRVDPGPGGGGEQDAEDGRERDRSPRRPAPLVPVPDVVLEPGRP